MKLKTKLTSIALIGAICFTQVACEKPNLLNKFNNEQKQEEQTNTKTNDSKVRVDCSDINLGEALEMKEFIDYDKIKNNFTEDQKEDELFKLVMRTDELVRSGSGTSMTNCPPYRNSLDAGAEMRSRPIEGLTELHLTRTNKEDMLVASDGSNRKVLINPVGVELMKQQIIFPMMDVTHGNQPITPINYLTHYLGFENVYYDEKTVKKSELNGDTVISGPIYLDDGTLYQDLIVKYGLGVPNKKELNDEYLDYLNKEAELDLMGVYYVPMPLDYNVVRKRLGLPKMKFDEYYENGKVEQ